ncbi:MAG: hypothetical protein ABFC85_07015 [Rectinema sp.]
MDEFHELINRIATTPFERAEADWREALTRLGLPLFYQPALARALGETNWRGARDVGKYLRGTTYRQAKRMGLAEVKGPVPVSCLLGAESDDNAYARILDGASRIRSATGVSPPAGADLTEDAEESPYDCVDPPLMMIDPYDGYPRVNWASVGERVGLGEVEVSVLEARSDGLTTAQILEEEAADAQERLRFQAAYRNVHRRMPDIAAVLKGKCPQKSGRRVHRTVEGKGCKE